MEVGPTMHYVMGGIKVDPETAESTVPGLYAAGEVAGGLARRKPPRGKLTVGPGCFWASGWRSRRDSG